LTRGREADDAEAPEAQSAGMNNATATTELSAPSRKHAVWAWPRKDLDRKVTTPPLRRLAISESHTKGTIPMTTTIERRTDEAPPMRAITVTQYSKKGIFMIWAASAIPMGVLSWIVAPAVANGSDMESMARPLLACITVGLVWQFVLAMGLVGYEQRSLRWSRLRDAMWLRSPTSPKTGRVGGKTWLIVIPLIVAFALIQEAGLPAPVDRDLGGFLQTDAGQSFFDGAWGIFGLFMVMSIFNTVLGEELLYRGVLLPRMQGAFGKRDWIANAVLFSTYHLHVPWAMTNALIDGSMIAYFTKRYRSAWIGIVVHSAQTVVLGLIVLVLVV
jgi:membrane protease YdiL (CAAX protease family)